MEPQSRIGYGLGDSKERWPAPAQTEAGHVALKCLRISVHSEVHQHTLSRTVSEARGTPMTGLQSSESRGLPRCVLWVSGPNTIPHLISVKRTQAAILLIVEISGKQFIFLSPNKIAALRFGQQKFLRSNYSLYITNVYNVKQASLRPVGSRYTTFHSFLRVLLCLSPVFLIRYGRQ